MIKDVFININATQGIDDETENIELTTEGKFGIRDGQYFIKYSDGGMLDDGKTVKTQIFIKNKDKFVLERSGAIVSRMIIEKEKRNTCFYSTPMGELVIGIFGEVLEADLTEHGGKIKLGYTIDSDLRMISRNTVNITISERGKI